MFSLYAMSPHTGWLLHHWRLPFKVPLGKWKTKVLLNTYWLQGTRIFCDFFLFSSKQNREVGRLAHPSQMRKSALKKLWKQARHDLTVMGQSQDGNQV